MPLLASPSGSITLSPDDILKMDGLFELVDGQLVEKQVSFLSGETSVEVSFVLRAFLKTHPLGKLVSQVTFKCFPNNENQNRRPDLAFIPFVRLGEDDVLTGDLILPGFSTPVRALFPVATAKS